MWWRKKIFFSKTVIFYFPEKAYKNEKWKTETCSRTPKNGKLKTEKKPYCKLQNVTLMYFLENKLKLFPIRFLSPYFDFDRVFLFLDMIFNGIQNKVFTFHHHHILSTEIRRRKVFWCFVLSIYRNCRYIKALAKI